MPISPCKIKIILFLKLLSLLFVKCDLPIHTLTRDVIGVWKLSETSLSDNFQNCGSTNPNKNSENLKIDNFKLYLEEIYGNLTENVVELSSERSFRHNLPFPRNKWSYFSVKDVHSNQVIGHWTLVYDEGIMIDVEDKNYFGYFKYSHINNSECKRLTGEINEDSFGNIKCYETDPSKLHIGWFSERDKNGFKFGCFYSQKLYNNLNNNNTNNNNSNNNLNNNNNNLNNNGNKENNVKFGTGFGGKNYTVDLTSLYYNSGMFRHKSLNFKNKFSDYNKDDYNYNKGVNNDNLLGNSGNNLINNIVDNYANLTPFRFTQMSKGVFYYPIHNLNYTKFNSNDGNSNFKLINDNNLKNKNFKNLLYPCDFKDHLANRFHSGNFDFSKLPKNWSWGDPYNGLEEDIYLAGQGNCGSCYALSSLYVISKRFHILLKKLRPNRTYKLNQFSLNINDILNSTFNQGCYGGFLMLVGKHGKELGISSTFYESFANGSNSANDENLSFLNANQTGGLPGNNRFFLSNYGYVGGCYECTNELNMMAEIFSNGPISSSIYLPNDFNFDSNEVYDVNCRHGMVCDVPNKDLNGWEFVNHSIVVVGWGETVKNDKKIKFWICKNTWGRDWGNEGFFKIKRGDNLLGVESQATFFDPDLNRGLALLI